MKPLPAPGSHVAGCERRAGVKRPSATARHPMEVSRLTQIKSKINLMKTSLVTIK